MTPHLVNFFKKLILIKRIATSFPATSKIEISSGHMMNPFEIFPSVVAKLIEPIFLKNDLNNAKTKNVHMLYHHFGG